MKTTTFIFTLVLVFFIQNAFAQTGEEIYKAQCLRCHTIGGGQLVGPDLKGTMKKNDEQWLIKWIRSSQTLINDGDEKAKALFEKYNEVQMADNDFTDEQIKSVIAYVKEQSGEVATAATASSATPATSPTSASAKTATTPTATAATPVATTQTASNNVSGTPVAIAALGNETHFSFDAVTLIMIAAAIVIMITVVILTRTVLILTTLYKRDSEMKKAA